MNECMISIAMLPCLGCGKQELNLRQYTLNQSISKRTKTKNINIW
jgi:hypothetical protein